MKVSIFFGSLGRMMRVFLCTILWLLATATCGVRAFRLGFKVQHSFINLRAVHKVDGNDIEGDLTPVSNNLLIKVREAKDVTSGGLFIPGFSAILLSHPFPGLCLCYDNTTLSSTFYFLSPLNAAQRRRRKSCMKELL